MLKRLPFLLALALPFFMYGPLIGGDSSIYFTFIKDFTISPFSYGGEVRHGATGPLWVLLNVIPFHVLGFSHWLKYAFAENILLVLFSAACLAETGRRFARDYLVIVALFLGSSGLFIYSAQLYETALSVALIALSAHLFLKGKDIQSIGLAGLAILARPELAVWGGALLLIMLWTERNRPSNKMLRGAIGKFLLLISPAVIYYAYMWFATGELVSSSVAGRAITSLENEGLSYLVRAKMSLAAIHKSTLLAAMLVIVSPFCQKSRAQLLALSGLPLLAVYVVFPPLEYASRYLLPLLPIAAPLMLVLAEKLWTRRDVYFVKPVFVLMLVIFSVGLLVHHYEKSGSLRGRYDWDTLLGKDLSLQLRKLAVPAGSRVLAYEIQTQFYTNARLISADGIVGGEILKLLLGHESMEAFLRRNHVKYVVTMNSFKYRTSLSRTPLVKLYEHDLVSDIGEAVSINGMTFKKIATNPCFSDPKCYAINAEGLRVYSDKNVKWNGYHFIWNSLYSLADSAK